ncbi:MAG: Fe-S cluster assembly protein SufD [Ilumatobacteraceae bacterium]
MNAASESVMDFPSVREEAWRYTPVDEIVSRLEAATAAAMPPTGASVSLPVVDALAGDHAGPRIVFVNGAYAAHLSADDDDLPAGLWCGLADLSHGRAAANVALAGIDHAIDAFLARNHADGRDSAVVVIDPGVRIDVPIHVVHLTAPDDGDELGDSATISHPRTIIDVGDDSHIALIQTYCGLDGRAVTNASTTIRIGRRAEVDHCRVQTESTAATHIGHTRIEQEEGSLLRMTSVTIGGDIARNAISVHLNGTDVQTELSGVNVTTGRQRHDTVVTVDHAASRCASTQRFRGVVDDHGRGSFSGEIIVRPGTVATDAHQSNRNLILSPNAEADTRPWLQILADDVRCTHGATVGRLDDDALFYLRSRGIPLDAARMMLIAAFIRDITDAIPHESLRAHVAAIIASSKSVVATDIERLK